MFTPEQIARQKIDRLLVAYGWTLQNPDAFNRKAALGVAVREFQLKAGPCDYLLFVDGRHRISFHLRRMAEAKSVKFVESRQNKGHNDHDRTQSLIIWLS